ncbi:Zn(2)-C6 fungal-type domain-containing protein [Mycena kentingensis (nom. inval.)]|nr:Zn(2)-C6 fungal-type domain-containing protein [Mycena kentingensis (nom. inval.)]
MPSDPAADPSPRSPTFTLIPNPDQPYAGFPFVSSPAPSSDASDHPDERDARLKLKKTVPPYNAHRTLVLCFDGTGDQFDDDNSNVVNFFSMLKKDDPSQQLVYYQAGIGTYNIPQVARPWLAKVHRTIDAMLGYHLNSHVMGGYEFLMQNYQHGDKICLFGFSRGAYTARALAGMLHKVGLLPKCNHQQVPFAYKMYSKDDEAGWKQSTAFKKAFSIDVDIEFLGVWDTVASVGLIPRRLPFTRSNTHVRYFRHAIALDEHRARFLPNFWNRVEEALRVGEREMHGPSSRKREAPQSEHLAQEEAEHEEHHDKEDSEGEKKVTRRSKTLHRLETEYSGGERHATHVEEVWFAGAHCDVGGGAHPNDTRNHLARIPLRWMIRQCFLLQTGIIFHADTLRLAGLEPSTLYPRVLPRPPPPAMPASIQTPTGTTAERTRKFVSEEEEDLVDALCPINDELKRVRAWWLLEWIPQQLRFQDHDKGDSWVKKLIIHRARGRHIPRQSTHGVKIHRTVKMRMDALGYEPRARLKMGTEPEWVD